MTAVETVILTHASHHLALHRLSDGDGAGHPLLLLHGLGERTPDAVPPHLRAWPGAVWGLDLTGHGESDIPEGGGYTAELLMADVDQALAHLGTVTLHGRGLGAYVALLAAGGRPNAVAGAILADGPGLAGGGDTRTRRRSSSPPPPPGPAPPTRTRSPSWPTTSAPPTTPPSTPARPSSSPTSPTPSRSPPSPAHPGSRPSSPNPASSSPPSPKPSPATPAKPPRARRGAGFAERAP